MSTAHFTAHNSSGRPPLLQCRPFLAAPTLRIHNCQGSSCSRSYFYRGHKKIMPFRSNWTKVLFCHTKRSWKQQKTPLSFCTVNQKSFNTFLKHPFFPLIFPVTQYFLSKSSSSSKPHTERCQRKISPFLHEHISRCVKLFSQAFALFPFFLQHIFRVRDSKHVYVCGPKEDGTRRCNKNSFDESF